MSAGGVIYRVRNWAVEIFFIKDSFGKWSFPKGHQELGETLAETAVRETKEETGLERLKYVAPLGMTTLRFRRQVGLIHKDVHYFLFEVPPDAKAHFKTREEVGYHRELVSTGKWVKLKDAFDVLGYKNSLHLLSKATAIILNNIRVMRHAQPNTAMRKR